MIKYLWCDKIKWGKWRRHCDAALGDQWPSDSISEGGSSASGDPGPSGCDEVDRCLSEADIVSGWGSWAGWGRMVQDFIMLLRMASLVAQMVKNLPEMQEIWVQSLGQEDPLEKGTAAHSSILAWRIPWTEDPGGLQSMELQSWTLLSN